MPRSISGLTFPYEVLQILTTKKFDFPITPEEARAVTAWIVLDLQMELRDIFGLGAFGKKMGAALIEALDLDIDVKALPRQRWEGERE